LFSPPPPPPPPPPPLPPPVVVIKALPIRNSAEHEKVKKEKQDMVMKKQKANRSDKHKEI